MMTLEHLTPEDASILLVHLESDVNYYIAGVNTLLELKQASTDEEFNNILKTIPDLYNKRPTKEDIDSYYKDTKNLLRIINITIEDIRSSI